MDRNVNMYYIVYIFESNIPAEKFDQVIMFPGYGMQPGILIHSICYIFNE